MILVLGLIIGGLVGRGVGRLRSIILTLMHTANFKRTRRGREMEDRKRIIEIGNIAEELVNKPENTKRDYEELMKEAVC